MMARSTTRSNQRPDTLMQDRRRQFDEIFLQRTAGPYIGVKNGPQGAFAVSPLIPSTPDIQRPRRHVGFVPNPEVGPTPSPRQHGRERGRPSRSITTETPTKTVDQLEQHYKCSACNPGKRPDTRKSEFGLVSGSRDTAHDSYLRIAVLRCEPPRRWESRDRRRAH
jgi:hypothetical protein